MNDSQKKGLHNLSAPVGAKKKRKRVGRGESSGWGKTAGRGHKGQKARTGKGKPGLGFEGGQMPMYRRMPKRGFFNRFGVDSAKVAEVNVDVLARAFAPGENVDLVALKKRGLARNRHWVLRILGRGGIDHALIVTADHVSASARQKIEAAGGEIAASSHTSKA